MNLPQVLNQYNDFPFEFETVNNEVYVNATVICQAYGKRISEWLRLPHTQRYIEALKENGENPSTLTFKRLGCVGSGAIWIHEKLILNLARWLDIDFAYWCSERIAGLQKKGHIEWQPVSYADRLRALADQVDEQQRIKRTFFW